MQVGRPVAAILYGLARGPLMLYNGQEVGEPAAGAEGFGDDDSRTTIFDYWSMPALLGWINGHQYDGAKLSPEQKELRAFYSRLVRLNNEPAFRDGGLLPLNSVNRANPHFGRVGDEGVSGHWCYAFLRADRATEERFLVVANLHPHATLRDLRVALPAAAREFLHLAEGTTLKFTDRLALDPVSYESPDATSANIREMPQLSALYLEIEPNDR